MRNRLLLLLLLLVSLHTLSAQGDGRDYRAVLDVRGRMNEISVSPNGRIWLTTLLGNLYYANTPGTNWHYGSLTGEVKRKDEKDYWKIDFRAPDLDRITFFNNDTAILSGFIYGDTAKEKHGGYYRTTDGGRTWELRDFGGDQWIYDAVADRDGHAWMVTSEKTIYYSDDFGLHFKQLLLNEIKESFNADWILVISMRDARHGVIGTKSNELLLTDDNWQTARKIPTPLDQELVTATDDRYHDDRIQKVLLWNDFILVKQLGETFYTSRESITWQPLPHKVFDFALDPNSNRLMAVGDNRHAYVFTTPTQGSRLSEDSLPKYYPIDIKAVDGRAYMLMADGTLFLADHDGLRQQILYTTDHPIEEPWLTAKGKSLTWGADGHHLYLSEKKSRKRWYREAVTPFYVHSIKLLEDSTIVLWDGQDNHCYSLRSHTMKPYFPKEPLRDFLSAPVIKFTIQAGSQGCFHYMGSSITYNTTPRDSLFEATTVAKVESWERNDSVVTGYTVSKSRIFNLLNEINTHPDRLPNLGEFQISDSDIQHYLDLVDTILNMGKYSFERRFPDSDGPLYKSVPMRLQEIDSLALREILNTDEGFTSTTSCWFAVEFVNQNRDTLRLESDYYDTPWPWYIPWLVYYKGIYFQCYSLDFSRQLERLLPEDFFGRDGFDNTLLLMRIGDYLRQKEQ